MIIEFDLKDIPSETVASIYAYWRGKMVGGKLPTRKDINPAELASLLPHVNLLDVEHTPLRFKARLMGSETVRAYDYDMTGEYFESLPNIEEALAEFRWLVENKRPYLIINDLAWSDQARLHSKQIALPLSSDGETVDMIMFGVDFEFPQQDRTQYPNTRLENAVPMTKAQSRKLS